MYSFQLEELLEKYKPQEVLTDDIIIELIRKELSEWKDTPARHFLLYHATWDRSQYHGGKWIAYSQIYNRYDGGVWPIYDIDLEFVDDENEIEYHSWKADYDPEVDNFDFLQGEGPRKNLRGTVWTRGE